MLLYRLHTDQNRNVLNWFVLTCSNLEIIVLELDAAYYIHSCIYLEKFSFE